MNEKTLSPEVQESLRNYPGVSRRKVISLLVVIALVIWSAAGLDYNFSSYPPYRETSYSSSMTYSF